MGSSKKRRRQLKLAHRAHPLSHIIRSITSKTKHRLLREHRDRRRPRTHTENLLTSDFTFSGYGARFQQYGKLNHHASGWNADRIDRLLEPRVSNEEMNLPDGPEPRLDSDYIDKHLLCLPEELRRNIRRQGVKKRQRRIESYFVNTYGYIPPRVRRLISGSYRPSHKGLPALRRTAKSDARRRYIQHLSGSSSPSSPSSTVSTPPRRQQQPRRASAAARKLPPDSSPSTSHMSPLGFDMSPISPSIHDIIQQVQGKQPLPNRPNRPSSSLSSSSPQQQGTPFQVVNRQYDRSRSPSVEITGDQAGHTPPPPTPPTPPGEKEYEEYDEDSPPYSTGSNFMGFSPLQGPPDTPPPLAAAQTPGQMAMNLVEDSAKDLETVLNVAETGVKSLLSRIRAGEKVVAAAGTAPQPPANTDSSWITNDNDSDAALHDILQEEFNHPPINTSIGDQRQHTMEMESMYDDLLDHNNTPIPQTPPREQRLEIPPLYTPASRKPMSRIAYKQPMPLPPPARIAHKAPMAPPPPPLPLSRKILAPPYPVLSPPSMFRDRRRKSAATTYPILSPPSMFRDKTKNFGSQVGNDRGVHNSLNDIFHDFCTGKKNTREATHKIMDIVHQVSKYNIR